jgi:hypothetical protein
MTTQKTNGDAEGAETVSEPVEPTAKRSAASSTATEEGGWPELDQLVESIKTKRSEEIARQEEQRNAAQRAAQEAQKAWSSIEAQRCLDEMATRLADLGVVARPTDTVAGSASAALELSRLPKGESATIRIDTTPSRNGPPRTTVQVQRGNQQLAPVTLNVNTNTELRKTLIEIAQKLLA